MNSIPIHITDTIIQFRFAFRSQIGKCKTPAAMRKQVELQKAIEKRSTLIDQSSIDLTEKDEVQAKKNVSFSPRPSLLDLMKHVQEENKNPKEQT